MPTVMYTPSLHECQGYRLSPQSASLHSHLLTDKDRWTPGVCQTLLNTLYVKRQTEVLPA